MPWVTAMSRAPTVFISYSWESAAHKEWVRTLAARLMADGVKVTLDQWHAVPGDQLPEFMEREITRSQYILIICTPHYRARARKPSGGVRYEGDIMTAEVLGTNSRQKQRKFIPILRTGSWKQSAPSWLQGKYRIHLDGDPYSEDQYQDLLATLHDARPKPPPLGPRPAKYQVEELRKHLESWDLSARYFAVRALRQIGAAAVPALVGALQKEDNLPLRKEVIDSLGSIGPTAKAAVPALVAELKDDHVQLRKSAAEALGQIGPAAKSAIPRLVAALEDEDDETREWAADALGYIGPAAVQLFVVALKDKRIGLLAARALAGIGSSAESAIPALVAALKHGAAKKMRWWAIDALGNIGPAAESAIPAIAKALKHRDGSIRSCAARALGQIGPVALPTLVSALKNAGPSLRASAAEALGEIGSGAESAVPALVAALKHDAERYVRESAASSLGKIGAAAVPSLIVVLHDTDADARSYAANALGEIGPAAKSAVPALVEALKDADIGVRMSAETALPKIGRAAVPALVEALTDTSDDVRKSAAKTLGKIGKAAKSAVPALADALQDANSWVRCLAAESLEKIGPAANGRSRLSPRH